MPTVADGSWFFARTQTRTWISSPLPEHDPLIFLTIEVWAANDPGQWERAVRRRVPAGLAGEVGEQVLAASFPFTEPRETAANVL